MKFFLLVIFIISPIITKSNEYINTTNSESWTVVSITYHEFNQKCNRNRIIKTEIYLVRTTGGDHNESRLFNYLKGKTQYTLGLNTLDVSNNLNHLNSKGAVLGVYYGESRCGITAEADYQKDHMVYLAHTENDVDKKALFYVPQLKQKKTLNLLPIIRKNTKSGFLITVIDNQGNFKSGNQPPQNIFLNPTSNSPNHSKGSLDDWENSSHSNTENTTTYSNSYSNDYSAEAAVAGLLVDGLVSLFSGGGNSTPRITAADREKWRNELSKNLKAWYSTNSLEALENVLFDGTKNYTRYYEDYLPKKEYKANVHEDLLWSYITYRPYNTITARSANGFEKLGDHFYYCVRNKKKAEEYYKLAYKQGICLGWRNKGRWSKLRLLQNDLHNVTDKKQAKNFVKYMKNYSKCDLVLDEHNNLIVNRVKVRNISNNKKTSKSAITRTPYTTQIIWDGPLRKAPSYSSKTIYNCPKNAQVEVLDNSREMYYKVKVNGYTGYIAKGHLEKL